MAIMGSVTAVVQIPLFLMFESIPCTVHPSRQTCSLGPGSYFNIISITLWVVMTVWAQCVLPPAWNEDGRVTKEKRDPVSIREIVIPSSETDTSTANESNEKRDVEQGAPRQQDAATKPEDKSAPISLVAYDEFDDISEMTPSVAGERQGKKSQRGVKR